MININNAKKYCSEDISLIENYHQAITDEENYWEIHHLRECDQNGRTLFTYKQLKEMDLYYNRPASELIFVTRYMHMNLHRENQHNWHSNGGKIGGKKNSIPILQFSKDGMFIKEWTSIIEAGRQLRTSIGNICACLNGRRKSAGGFVWKYK